MGTVTSKDGTRIAFDQSGEGPAIILVVGAFNDRTTGAPLAQVLEQHFTVFNYDRRGRGESDDTPPYAIEREIEDLGALTLRILFGQTGNLGSTLPVGDPVQSLGMEFLMTAGLMFVITAVATDPRVHAPRRVVAVPQSYLGGHPFLGG